MCLSRLVPASNAQMPALSRMHAMVSSLFQWCRRGVPSKPSHGFLPLDVVDPADADAVPITNFFEVDALDLNASFSLNQGEVIVESRQAQLLAETEAALEEALLTVDDHGEACSSPHAAEVWAEEAVSLMPRSSYQAYVPYTPSVA